MIYIDCGYYAGNAYRKHEVDDTWAVYAFEPNPDITVPDWVIPKAVWVEDGEVSFQIGGRDDAASIKGTSGHSDPRIITVPCIDFSEFVAGLPDVYTICSMDVEGAEFQILKKMLAEHTIDKIDLLDIEFHHRLMLDYGPDDAQALINQIEDRGVKVELKVPLE